MRQGFSYFIWWIRQRYQAYKFNRAITRRINNARQIDRDIQKQLDGIQKHYGS